LRLRRIAKGGKKTGEGATVLSATGNLLSFLWLALLECFSTQAGRCVFHRQAHDST
jgi:hypothetical protein